MIVDIRQGNVFESGCQTTVVTTNTVGVMGKGVALEAKRRYSDVERPYKDLCKSGTHQIGHLDMHPTTDGWLLLFPTKQHWRNPSQLEWIEQGLKYLRAHTLEYPFGRIESLAVPPLGCGNGGLDFSQVRPLIEYYLESWPVSVVLYTP